MRKTSFQRLTGRESRYGRVGIVSVIAALLITGCVEFTGQRIAMRYEPEADRLTLRISYDGPYETGEKTDHAIGYLKSLLAGEAVMFLHSFCTLPLTGLSGFAEEVEANGWQAGSELLLAIERNASLRSLGHYRDVEGRVGFAQELRIEHASEILELVNRFMDEAVLAGELGPDEEELPGTYHAFQRAAQAGQRWFWFEGQALRADFPVPFHDWQHLEREALLELMRDTGKEDQARNVAALLSAGISMEKHPDHVRLTLGLRDRATVLRFPIQAGYLPNLAETVLEMLPTEYDAGIANRILSSPAEAGGDPSGEGEMVLPEDEVRALLRELEGADAERQGLAAAALDRRAESWNHALRLPRAPAAGLAYPLRAEAWGAWTRALLGVSD